MALRRVTKMGEPVLRKKCKPVTKFDEKLGLLLDDMADTMYEADGVGLAAPQVGMLKRAVVIDVGEGRRVTKMGEPVLRKKCKPVTKFDEKLGLLLDDMADTMYEADGVGLAAPQVGMLKRAVVIDVGEGIIELINPEIIEASGKQTDIEGCLSVDNINEPVTRPYFVKVKAQDFKCR